MATDTDNPVFTIYYENGTAHKESEAEHRICNGLTENVPSDEKAKTPLTSDEARIEMRRIMKNVILISLAFFFTFNSYNGLLRLQSSLHRDKGMGVIAGSISHLSRILGCLALPNIAISFLGHKWAIPLGLSGYCLWMAANGYAVWATMAPTSVLVGVCGSFLWTAQSSYLTISAKKYSLYAKELQSTIVTRFFGIFFCCFQISGMTGAIMSSLILHQPPPNITDETLAYCGVNDCPSNEIKNPNESPPDGKTVWILVGIYIGVTLFGILLVAMFLDELPRDDQESTEKRKTTQLLIATIKQLKNKKQLALIPLTMHTGFTQAAFSAEFTKSYITCALGLWKVGLVVIAFSIVNATVSLTSGIILKYTGRIPICTTGFLVDIAVLIILLTWSPHPDEEYLFYVIGALWGFKDGILQTQVNGLYGSTFQHSTEAAYANYRMFESAGFALAYAYSSFLCTSVKLYILIASLIMASISYFTIEYWNRMEDDKLTDNSTLITVEQTQTQTQTQTHFIYHETNM